MNDLMTKSFTNYVDLKKSALKDIESGPEEVVDIAAAAQTGDESLNLFLEEAGRVKEEMDYIRDLLVGLQESSEEIKSLHKPDELKALRHKINGDIVVVLKKGQKIRAQLEAMDRTVAANRRLSGLGPANRNRTSVTNGLRRKLKELMLDFQALRQKVMAEHRETVERRYYTVTGETPGDDVIERIISNGETDDIIQKAIKEHGRGSVVATVAEIQDRHGAAKEIERSLLELHQVFLDMAVMVEAQGEQMDDIEHHVMNASHYVKDGTKELQSAKQYQRSKRKWMCIGVILLLLIILVIVVPIVASLSHS